MRIPATPEDAQILTQAADLLKTNTLELPVPLPALLCRLFEQWGRMGALETDLLHRVGGPETIRLARAVLTLGEDTP